MSSHPEQLRVQIEDALAASIPFHLLPEDVEIELSQLLPGKSPSHFIAVFYTSGSLSEMKEWGYEVRSEMIDEVASSINRRRVQNITFKVTNIPLTFEA